MRPSPHFAKYSGVVLFDQQDGLLLQRRDIGIESNPGILSVFGGSVEPDETFEQAAIREIFEEIGVRLTSPLNFLGTLLKDEVHQLVESSYFVSDLEIHPSHCREGSLETWSIDKALVNPEVGKYSKIAIYWAVRSKYGPLELYKRYPHFGRR